MVTEQNIARLMTWLSPGFPVGAFAYSHGIEHAVEQGGISDCESLAQWVEGILSFGAGRIDAAFFRAAFEAMRDADPGRLDEAVLRANAQRSTAELALESMAQGRAFLETLVRTWPNPRLKAWHDGLRQSGRDAAYPIAVGAASALAGIPLRPALTAYLHAFAANLVSAAVRLVPLGQTDGQRAIMRLEPRILEAATAALARDPDDFGGAALAVDWHSMQHETQYTRLFRS